MQRLVLHFDLDYFYAQAEEIRRPELKEKPFAVGIFSGRSEFSGAIATSNYKAREFGIKAGIPISFAKKKCESLIVLKADREYYEMLSDRVMEIIREKGEKFEQLSIDEACLEVTETTRGNFAEAEKLGKKIKEEIFEKEKLTCSVGLGPNKLIAKMAADSKKPNGFTSVIPSFVKEFLRSKKISDITGIGPKTIEELEKNGIRTIPELASTPLQKLIEVFGEKKGKVLYERANGIDNDPVLEKEPQQYSRLMTLKENSSNALKIIEESKELAEDLAKKCVESKKTFKVVSIIIVSSSLQVFTKSKTLQKPSQKTEEILVVSKELLESFINLNKNILIRRFGFRISGLEEKKKQPTLFDY
ncbi:MAG: DNA polymerase IV [Candidatus Diapherotrites archaeon]